MGFTKTTTITMPEEEFEKMQIYCQKHDIKQSQLVRKAIKPILENE